MPTLLQTGDVRIEPAFIPNHQLHFAALRDTIAWDDRMRARKAMSFGVPYNYSGITWPPTPFPDLLATILASVARHVGFVPNNCLAHYYADGSSTMGFHSDATDELDSGTGIAIVSLGGTRALTFRPMAERQRREAYPLVSGSLLFMSPAMQDHWQHAILATEDAEPRISLTFRRLKTTD